MTTIVAVSAAPRHGFSKTPQTQIRLLQGLGVEGDAHCGERVRHRYAAQRNPAAPNLRQVHLMAQEWLESMRAKGFDAHPGAFGENIVTRGLPLTRLSAGTRLRLGADAVIELTGLRKPCVQMDRFQAGLKAASTEQHDEGVTLSRAGVMAIVVSGGDVFAGDAIVVEPAPEGAPALDYV